MAFSALGLHARILFTTGGRGIAGPEAFCMPDAHHAAILAVHVITVSK